MHVDSYGTGHCETIVFLHGAHLVHSFYPEYVLREDFQLLIPHIMGFGEERHRIFDTETCLCELRTFLKTLTPPVTLVGFSLGAQLAYALLCDPIPVCSGAVLISPMLFKTRQELEKLERLDRKSGQALKKGTFSNLGGLIRSLPDPFRETFLRDLAEEQPETAKRMIFNPICLSEDSLFAKSPVPVLALAGAWEPESTKNSVRSLARLNPLCQYEIWENAAHNIPTAHAERLIATIRRFLSEKNKTLNV